jgi:hypothetical protein
LAMVAGLAHAPLGKRNASETLLAMPFNQTICQEIYV